MAKVFLDTNYFIDAVERKPKKAILESLKGHSLFISPLSVAIYCYLYKIKVPNKQLSIQLEEIQSINLSQKMAGDALLGPTPDYEDNIQLHSASEAECEYFLTNDKRLLKLKFFGKLKILSSFPKN